MKYHEAAWAANLARDKRTSHEIATGVTYTVGLPLNGGENDYYVNRIGPVS